MAYALRPYQLFAVDSARTLVGEGAKSILIVAPTGAGKTVIGAHIMQRAAALERKCGFVAHRIELLEQCSGKLTDAGVPHGIIQANHPRYRPWEPVQVCSIDTMRARTHVRPQFDLLMIDEAHRAVAQSYMNLRAEYPDAVLIGLTATPFRRDGAGLGAMFDRIVVVSTPEQLISEGFLLEPRVFAPSKPDLGGIKITRGDFDEKESAAVMAQARLVADVVESWQRHAAGRRTVVYGVTVEHSKLMRDRFVAAGIRAEHLDGKTPGDERRGILARLASGETTVVCNVGVLTEGYDLPSLGCVSIARPTRSASLFLQMCGRVMRPFEDKVNPVILDHAGCSEMHGLPTEDRTATYTLDGREPRPKAGEKPSTSWLCEKCYLVNPVALMACKYCGAARVIKVRPPDEAPGELVEVSARCPACKSSKYEDVQVNGGKKTLRRCVDCGAFIKWVRTVQTWATLDTRRSAWAYFQQTATQRGFRMGWAIVRYKLRFGSTPREDGL